MSLPILLTGDRPTGSLHLGHYIGSLVSRTQLQHTYNSYIMIADVQALTDHAETPDLVRHNVMNVMADYLSVGLDPNYCTFFIQSAIPAIAELAIYYLNLVSVARLERNPTVKNEIQQKAMHESIPAGFLCYPVHQAADITAFQASVVPVGDDQLPMIEQTNEIVRKFNRIYQTECLKECKPILSQTPRLMGIDGSAKASKSIGNAIFLSDTAEEVKRKIWTMYTDPNHIHISDPGRVEGHVVFAYLDAFHPDKEEIKALKEHYQKGGLGDVMLKNLLNITLHNLLEPIRAKRATLTESYMRDVLHEGNQQARSKASETLIRVKEAMHIFYS